MSIFYQEEAPNPSKRSCKCIVSALKIAFAKCHSFRGKLPYSFPQEPDTDTDTDFDQEEEIFVSAVISKYMESKSRRKCSNFSIDSFRWALSEDPLILTPKAEAGDKLFLSVGSHLSAATSFDDGDAFVSAKTCFSRSSSLSMADFGVPARSIIMEFVHCQGWPFGLCRRALLLPPLPKSPADSWSWRNTAKFVNINGYSRSYHVIE